VLLDEKIGRWFNARLTFDNKFLNILDRGNGFTQMQLPSKGVFRRFFNARYPLQAMFYSPELLAYLGKKEPPLGRGG
jgi:hypothetical protein